MNQQITKHLKIKRVYDAPVSSDGTRVLVDRLWPRGLSKADAAVDQWSKELAPSAALRKWFGHKPERWDEFRKRYRSELAGHTEAISELQKLARKGTVTLLFGAHDEVHNNAVALVEFMSRH
jgi:uncharacterized protein YeaO (DUF488 family)